MLEFVHVGVGIAYNGNEDEEVIKSESFYNKASRKEAKALSELYS